MLFSACDINEINEVNKIRAMNNTYALIVRATVGMRGFPQVAVLNERRDARPQSNPEPEPTMDLQNDTDASSLDRYIYSLEVYYVPTLVVLGTAGNVLSICVFLTTKLRKLSSSYYLSSLAASDTLILLILLVDWLKVLDIHWMEVLWVCKLTTYAGYVFTFLSVWLITVFTIERFVAVRYPLLRQSICTVSRAKIVILVLFLVSAGLYLPMVWMSTIMFNEQLDMVICTRDIRWEGWHTMINSVDSVLTFLVPFVTVATLNTLICRSVWKLGQIRKRLTERGAEGSKRGDLEARTRKQAFSQNKITRMLLIVSTVSLLICLPSYIMRMLLPYVTVSI